MKCSNCGTEFEGNFCINCGTPAQAENTPVTPQPEVTEAPAPVQTQEQAPVENVAPMDNATPVENVAPVDYQAPADTQQTENVEPNTYVEQNNVEQNNATSYGQQFSNQPNNGFAGQQFTNQPATAPNGKKPMSGGKIAIIIVSIVLGLLIIFGIIIGVVACNIIKSSKGTFDKIVSDVYEEYENGDYGDYNYYYHKNGIGENDSNADIYGLSVNSESTYSLTA